MFATVACLLLCLFTRWTQTSMANRTAGMLSTAQEFATNFVTRLSRLEGEIRVDTAKLEAIVSAVARLNRSKTSARRARTWMTRPETIKR